MVHLFEVVEKRGGTIISQESGVTVEMDLPDSWEAYLEKLDKKQRHEVRRKLRRFWAAGNVKYHCQKVDSQDVDELTNTFLKLFSLSRGEKASFMTVRMQVFFRALAEAMAGIKLLRYGILEVESQPAAMIIGFDYNGTMYLYNSAYDPQYDSLSVGLLSKVLCIGESINLGRKKWDYLKGAERYKYQLGGREVKLYDCHVTLG
jgi:CelD/BcsL family acetyltransferase involved in cellulose biosynthesis